MSIRLSALARAIGALRRVYGPQPLPVARNALEMILWEQVGYLADDDHRGQAFGTLATRAGLTASAILDATDDAILAATTAGGIHAVLRASRIRETARLVMREFDGSLDNALSESEAKARTALKRFAMIGDPGVEKILLFTRRHLVFALDSNGLRVMLRLGYGREGKSYSTTYRSVQEAVCDEVVRDYDWLTQAHLLLRTHGRQLCRRADPGCSICPVLSVCRYGQRSSRRA
jgi:endonuclease III